MPYTVIRSALLGLACLAPLATPSSAEDLRFYNFAEYVNPAIIEDFQNENAIAVVQDFYAEPDIAESTLLARATQFDLAVVSLFQLQRLIKSDAIEPLNPARIGNIGALDPSFVDLIDRVEPNFGTFAAPYAWGTTGIVFDEAAVRARVPDAPLDSWQLIFDPEIAAQLSDCGIGMINFSEDIVGAALTYLGRDPLSRTEDDLDAAFATIREITPYIKSFDSSHLDELMAGEMCVAVTWSSDGLVPGYELQDKSFKFVSPKEGTNIWVDVLVLPAGSEHTEAAHRFIDHVYRPQQMANLMEWTYSVSFISDALPHLPDGLAEHLTLFPDLASANLYVLPQISGAEKSELDARWRQVVLGF